jgi:hypothetical protein
MGFLRITIVESCRGLRKLSGGPGYQNGDLLAPRRQERQVRKFNFFAAFAPLREIVRVLVAARPRVCFVVLSISALIAVLPR